MNARALAATGLVALALVRAFGDARDAGDVLSSGYGIIQRIIHTDGW